MTRPIFKFEKAFGEKRSHYFWRYFLQSAKWFLLCLAVAVVAFFLGRFLAKGPISFLMFIILIASLGGLIFFSLKGLLFLGLSGTLKVYENLYSRKDLSAASDDRPKITPHPIVLLGFGLILYIVWKSFLGNEEASTTINAYSALHSNIDSKITALKDFLLYIVVGLVIVFPIMRWLLKRPN